MLTTIAAWHNVASIRSESPLVLNITNYVAMNVTANALLALGASPVMAHAIEEIEELTQLASAVVLNIGTLSAPWIEAMHLAGRAARRRGIPIVLDPVGSAATRFRADTAKRLAQDVQPSVIRGNAAEIRSFLHDSGGARGVDSLLTPDEAVDDAKTVASRFNCTVSMSGPVDVITDGSRVVRVSNGHPIMTRVTAMGCTGSAVTGAFLAVNATCLEAAAVAMATVGVAGEIAVRTCAGPGTFQVHFLDALHGLTQSDFESKARFA